jgi:ABC-type sugar transport system ATPase subunit
MASIVFDRLTWHYPGAGPLFRDLSLRLEAPAASGRIYAVMGSSGCGKSTFLRLVAGLFTVPASQLKIAPVNLRLSYLTQEIIAFDHLSPRENARYFASIRAQRGNFDEALFNATAVRLRLDNVMQSRASMAALSGGERQRLALLRALSIRPELLLLDEPCSGLDLPVRQEFLRHLRRETDEAGILVVYVTHHAEEALLIGDEMIYIQRSDESQPASVVGVPLAEFQETPPNLEAAKMMSTSTLNVVPCELAAGELRPTCQPKAHLGRLSSGTAPDPGPYTLAFVPERIVWAGTDSDGVGVEMAGSSSRYAFIRLNGSTDIVVTSHRPDAGPTRIGLSGRVMLFRSVDQPPYAVEVSS